MNFTEASQKFDRSLSGKLEELIRISGPIPRRGETRLFFGLVKEYSAVCVVGLGDDCVSYNECEQMDERKENIRIAAASGVRALGTAYVQSVDIESFGHAESSAEGASLGVWLFQELRNRQPKKVVPKLELYGDCDYTGWQIGLQKAAAQNLCRQLCETPANLLTPIGFAQNSVDVLCKAGVNVEVKVRNWAKMSEMEGFLAAAKGSCEPPIFLEISYFGCEPDIAPIVLVGKGVTFDSGGLCLKTCEELKHMRGDMAGAGVVVAAIRAASALQLPLNLRGLVPLSENLPGTCALRPGDVIRSRNGKTIKITNTDFDGRLCLADALAYATVFNPKFILNVGTLSVDLKDIIGSAATAVFCNNDSLYEQMRIASIHTGDRIWRFPLWDHFTREIRSSQTVDVGEGLRPFGSPCSCAAFLREFVPPGMDWIHLDTYGVNRSHGDSWSYLRRGMSGRPTRTVVEFLAQFACQLTKEEQPRSVCETEAL